MNGPNLPSGLAMAVADCELMAKASSSSFTCIPRASGYKIVAVKDAPGEIVLFSEGLTVAAR